MASAERNDLMDLVEEDETLFQLGEGADVDGEEEDLALCSSGGVDQEFDMVIGLIEDIIMEDEFQTMKDAFMEKWYKEFEDSEENKFIYTTIHQEYVAVIEKYLESRLQKELADFDMSLFVQQLSSRRGELDGEIFDILLSFCDFVFFKEMMVDFRNSLEGNGPDLGGFLCVTPFK